MPKFFGPAPQVHPQSSIASSQAKPIISLLPGPPNLPTPPAPSRPSEVIRNELSALEKGISEAEAALARIKERRDNLRLELDVALVAENVLI
jgi:hypothetical protein